MSWFDPDKYLNAMRTLQPLYQEEMKCKRCPLEKTAERIVPPMGGETSPLAMVGEAPGEVDEIVGSPFTGPSGRLLEDALAALGLNRMDVFITNVVRCRPPGNRTPTQSEAKACYYFLERELLASRPLVIMCLGRPAAETLIERPFPITQRRGQWYSWNGIPTIATYHPAYILRQKGRVTSNGNDAFMVAKRHFWQDLLSAIGRIQEEYPSYGKNVDSYLRRAG